MPLINHMISINIAIHVLLVKVAVCLKTNQVLVCERTTHSTVVLVTSPKPVHAAKGPMPGLNPGAAAARDKPLYMGDTRSTNWANGCPRIKNRFVSCHCLLYKFVPKYGPIGHIRRGGTLPLYLAATSSSWAFANTAKRNAKICSWKHFRWEINSVVTESWFVVCQHCLV